MCGITGIIKFENSSIDLKSLLHSMTQALVHRGPDDEGYVFFDEENIFTAGGKDTPENVWNSHLPYSPAKNIHELISADCRLPAISIVL